VRSSRLLALLLALQRTGSGTAPALATELEVSVRTIYRDVAALQEAGVPIYTAPGAGGGIRLLEPWRSPVDGLTSDEVRALVVGGGPAADLGLGSVLAVARSKLRSGLPDRVRAELDLVAERFLLDAEAWFHPTPPTPLLDLISQGVWTQARLDVRYQRSRDRVVSRRLDPLGLVLKQSTWYLVARHRHDIRTYRVSRMASVRLRAERFDRPVGFDLERYWADASTSFDASIRHVATVLVLPPSSVRSLLGAVPGELTRTAVDEATTEPDGRMRVRLRVESVDVAFHQLAHVAGLEVASPPELRDQLHRHGQELAARNT